MTIRYYNIRREICNDHSDKKLNRLRTFKEIVELFTPFHWIIFIIMVLSFVSTIVITIAFDNKLWNAIPFFIIILCGWIWNNKAESLFNQKARQKEIDSINSDYETYLENIKIILIKNGINNKERFNCLKRECLSIFEERDKKYSFLNNRVFDLLIGIPLGALISTTSNVDSKGIPTYVVAILLMGIVVYSFILISKHISYYTKGYWQDGKVLIALDEIEYYWS